MQSEIDKHIQNVEWTNPMSWLTLLGLFALLLLYVLVKSAIASALWHLIAKFFGSIFRRFLNGSSLGQKMYLRFWAEDVAKQWKILCECKFASGVHQCSICGRLSSHSTEREHLLKEMLDNVAAGQWEVGSEVYDDQLILNNSRAHTLSTALAMSEANVEKLRAQAAKSVA